MKTISKKHRNLDRINQKTRKRQIASDRESKNRVYKLNARIYRIFRKIVRNCNNFENAHKCQRRREQ